MLDRGKQQRKLQYVSIKYTERLCEAGLVPSVGSVGDFYDNALAETINGLYKAEVIHRRADGLPNAVPSSGRHHFRLLMSFRRALSNIVSANSFFSLAFSSSSALSSDGLTAMWILLVCRTPPRSDLLDAPLRRR